MAEEKPAKLDSRFATRVEKDLESRFAVATAAAWPIKKLFQSACRLPPL
jgi:hypothetical protein